MAGQMLDVISHPLWGAVGFGLGFLLAHRLQLGRDRRAEFNAAAAPIRVWVARQLNNPTTELWHSPSREQMDAIYANLSRRQRRKFIHLWTAMQQHYANGYGERDAVNQRLFLGSDNGLMRLRELAEMVRHRT